jgi:hypothetical protein
MRNRGESNMAAKSPSSSSAEDTRLEKLAAEQGVHPIEDFDAFMAERDDVWPENESVDEFIETVRRWRREGEERKRP